MDKGLITQSTNKISGTTKIGVRNDLTKTTVRQGLETAGALRISEQFVSKNIDTKRIKMKRHSLIARNRASKKR